MPVIYTKKDQGKVITAGTGIPVHSGVAGDKYTDITSGVLYTYSNGGWKSTTLPSVQSVVSSATVTPTSTDDLLEVISQVGVLIVNNPTGTYANGQNFLIRLDGDGSAIIFDTKYIAFGSALPSTTTVGKTTLIGCTYNSNNDTFECLNSIQQ